MPVHYVTYHNYSTYWNVLAKTSWFYYVVISEKVLGVVWGGGVSCWGAGMQG